MYVLGKLAHSRTTPGSIDWLDARTDNRGASRICRAGELRRRRLLHGSVNRPIGNPCGLLRHANTTHEPDSVRRVDLKVRCTVRHSVPAGSSRPSTCVPNRGIGR